MPKSLGALLLPRPTLLRVRPCGQLRLRQAEEESLGHQERRCGRGGVAARPPDPTEVRRTERTRGGHAEQVREGRPH